MSRPDWVHLFAARFSLQAQQLRQRTPPAVLRVVCHVFALGVSSSRWSLVELTQRWHESHPWTLTSCPLP